MYIRIKLLPVGGSPAIQGVLKDSDLLEEIQLVAAQLLETMTAAVLMFEVAMIVADQPFVRVLMVVVLSTEPFYLADALTYAAIQSAAAHPFYCIQKAAVLPFDWIQKPAVPTFDKILEVAVFPFDWGLETAVPTSVRVLKTAVPTSDWVLKTAAPSFGLIQIADILTFE